MSTLALPSLVDIEAAARRLHALAVLTPLIENPLLNEIAGGRVFMKAEPLQRTGSFKFRGAYNFLSQIEPGARRNGVVAYSSGNHAQGVAAAAAILGIPATIVMPSDAPVMKVENTRGYGAEIVLYDRLDESREDIAAEIAVRTGATLVPPYDHPWTIAGQGTVGLEIVDQCAALNVVADAVLVCCGGGGLTAGIATVLSARSPETKVLTVEPEGFDDTRRSLEAQTRVANDRNSHSICDALLAPMPGELTFAAMQLHKLSGLTVTDAEVRDAVAFAWRHLKLVVEPGGAVTLAAILSQKIDCHGQMIAATLSGGNVDPAVFRDCLENA
ncbi:MAG: threonine/serine dehydratase [Alphaproteobacteria bacterium]|jgi:threonine dehydratase|nr:threonine/serine dehydratase [Alphaproteobacteria bacterium]